MPSIIEDTDHTPASSPSTPTTLPFPPVTKHHILNCSYHSWHPKYRTITPKSRLIPLTAPFLEYLRADGIVLPDDEEPEQNPHEWSDHDSGVFSESDNPDARDNDSDSDDEDGGDIAAEWREDVHNRIKTIMVELGGNVVPKLNWSAPKDATWMNANTMECRSPNDVYLLLKSSDFITHDLEHAFDDCEESAETPSIPYHLVLRKYVQFNPSVEFRCFVRNRKLLGICQRDLNHFDFLFQMKNNLASLIQEFFDVRLRDTFPDESFVFDVYVPAPQTKCWLVDVNPWAPRTDPLLFSWMELLSMPDSPERNEEDDVVRIPVRPAGTETAHIDANPAAQDAEEISDDDDDEDTEDEEADEELWLPELRLIRKTDPEAFAFNTPQYSAHKMPKDVVDAAGASGEGLREFARDWENILAKRREDDAKGESSDDE